MVGETNASADKIRHQEEAVASWFAKAWVALRIVLAIVIAVYVFMRSLDPAVSERKAMQRGDVELLQTLQAGNHTYTLRYVRSGARWNTVTKNGQRVFDSREADTLGCIRLRLRNDGVVELECQHVNRRDAIFFPLP